MVEWAWGEIKGFRIWGDQKAQRAGWNGGSEVCWVGDLGAWAERGGGAEAWTRAKEKGGPLDPFVSEGDRLGPPWESSLWRRARALASTGWKRSWGGH